jgi:predicted branched-subunit amino acid permease
MTDTSSTASVPCVAAHHEPSWREGVKTGLPSLFGIGVGLVVGIAMVKSG